MFKKDETLVSWFQEQEPGENTDNLRTKLHKVTDRISFYTGW